jgi:hypothetical protein
MSDPLTLEELDRDGAVLEGVAELGGDRRADFLRKAVIGGGALIGGGSLLGAFPGIAEAAVPKSDVAILNFALTLEFLEAEFYTQAERQGRLRGETATFARIVGRHERAHVAFLRRALGRGAVKKPRFNFKDTTSNQAMFQATAQTLEDTGVAAYLGQVGRIKNKKILGAAGSILPVEARHAAWIRDIRGSGRAPVPAPTAFEGAKTKAQILAAVRGTGFIVG